jgi:hypothetical protein
MPKGDVVSVWRDFLLRQVTDMEFPSLVFPADFVWKLGRLEKIQVCHGYYFCFVPCYKADMVPYHIMDSFHHYNIQRERSHVLAALPEKFVTLLLSYPNTYNNLEMCSGISFGCYFGDVIIQEIFFIFSLDKALEDNYYPPIDVEGI